MVGLDEIEPPNRTTLSKFRTDKQALAGQWTRFGSRGMISPSSGTRSLQEEHPGESGPYFRSRGRR